MQRETEERHLPTDTGSTGTKSVPKRRDVSRVRQGQTREIWRFAGKICFDPTDISTELPGKGEVRVWLTRDDGTACVVLHLKLAVQLQVAGDVREPAWEAVGIGHDVP